MCILSEYCLELHAEMLIWRPLFAGERFLFDYEDPGTGSFTPGYAITLRMKNHRHCDCLRSSPVVYVAEHVPSRRRSWPMNDAFTVPSARHQLLVRVFWRAIKRLKSWIWRRRFKYHTVILSDLRVRTMWKSVEKETHSYQRTVALPPGALAILSRTGK